MSAFAGQVCLKKVETSLSARNESAFSWLSLPLLICNQWVQPESAIVLFLARRKRVSGQLPLGTDTLEATAEVGYLR
jgi:hypothetical protein